MERGYSDVGCAPLDPAKSCDDDDYQSCAKVTFKFPFRHTEPADVGYAVYQSCWQLLHRRAQLQGVEDLTDTRYTNFFFQSRYDDGQFRLALG